MTGLLGAIVDLDLLLIYFLNRLLLMYEFFLFWVCILLISNFFHVSPDDIRIKVFAYLPTRYKNSYYDLTIIILNTQLFHAIKCLLRPVK